MTRLLNQLSRTGDDPGVRFKGGLHVMLGVFLLGLVALCFIACSVSGDVWNAAFRVMWLVLTAMGLLLLAGLSRLPQQLTANAKLTIEYEVNEKVSAESPDNFVTHKEEFQLYNYQPVNYQSGHRIVYTATVDSGVNLEGVVTEWKDVDYIEGTVLPEVK